MTMHLLGPAFSTTRTSSKKAKMSSGKYSKYCQDWIDYNKRMKKLGSKTKTFEEYLVYREGKFKPNLRGTTMPDYRTEESRKHRELYPSQSEVGVAFAKAPNTYTGDKLLGIATLHKSCLQPVFSRKDAEDISRMRR